MDKYMELRNRQQSDVNAFPMVYAFGKDQFVKAMKKLGLTPEQKDKVTSIYGCGDILLKTDVPAWFALCKRHRDELKTAMQDMNFAYDAFSCELANHEYAYTNDPTEALSALGITAPDLDADPRLRDCFIKACKDQIAWWKNTTCPKRGQAYE